jgi:cardiolipin synthase
MRMLHEYLPTAWHWLLLLVELIAAGSALIHVILRKNDPRAAGYWVALIILVPLLGALLYWMLGINIIRRSGKRYRAVIAQSSAEALASVPHLLPEWEEEVQAMPGLVHSLSKLSRMELVGGNSIETLRNGDEAMPAMIEAVRGAQRSVALISYIFESQGVGGEMVDALTEAMKRGVQVCVIVDAAGVRYSKPSIIGVLRKRGINVRKFQPAGWYNRIQTVNLRNHRKLLIIDGRTAFTGGMNIREGNMLKANPPYPVQDTQFRVSGPVVSQMQRVFAEDWQFCTGEWLGGEEWFPEPDLPGDVCAAGLPDGPDDDNQTISLAIASALAEAKKEVRIVTPYFLPPEPVFSALNSCALRGVKVRIVLPSSTANNLPFVHWASRTVYPALLKHGVRIFESSPPFDHSKILTIDGIFSMIGSTNLDPRSLKLNFEFNLACFDDHLTEHLNEEFDRKLRASTEVTMDMLATQTLAHRLRNGVARLFMPLL